MTTINLVQSQRIPEMKKPAWHETEVAARIAGIALIALAALIAAGTATGIAFAFIHLNLFALPTVFMGLGVLVGVGMIFNEGIRCLTFNCWQDPSFIKRAQKKVKEMPLDQIEQRYGLKKAFRYDLIDKKVFNKKLLEEVAKDKYPFSTICRKYKDYRSSFDKDALYPLMKKQVEEKGLSSFCNSYSLTVLKLYVDDPWLKQFALKEIEGKSPKELEKYDWTETSGGHGWNSSIDYSLRSTGLFGK